MTERKIRVEEVAVEVCSAADSRTDARIIRCTPENAAEVRAAVKAWPQLHGLIAQLQAAGHFPGLRSLTFHLVGTPQYLSKGLGAIANNNCEEV